MRILVLYFSLEGHCEKIAKIIKDELGADVERIVLKKPLPKGLFKYFIGGMMTLLNKRPEILPLRYNPEDYDFIFFCSPVWAGNIAAPFNSVISNYKIENKKIGIFSSYAGVEGNFEKFKSKLSNTDRVIIEKAFNERELGTDKAVEEIKSLLNNINS